MLENATFTRGDFIPPVPLMPGESAAPPNNGIVQAHFFVVPRFNVRDQKYEDVEMCEILMAGDVKSAPVKKVNESLIARFPAEYAKFKAGQEQTPDGFPIEQWLGKNSATLNLRSKHIHTVEQLAALPDGHSQELGMGGRELVERAKAFLLTRQKSQAAEQLAAEKLALNDALNRQNTAMEQQANTIAQLNSLLADMGARLAAVEGKGGPSIPLDPERRGPGRPRKTETSEE